jgi:hypothetical protein
MTKIHAPITTMGIATLLAFQIFFIASLAGAADLVGKTDVTFEWTAASGPVFEYAVFVDRNGGGFPGTPEQIVSATSVNLTGAYGDSLVVRVAARDDIGNQGPFSINSDVLRFVAPPQQQPPQLSLSTSTITATVLHGNDLANQIFTIQNTGGSTLEYSIVTDKPFWVTVSPASGTATTETDTISVSVDSATRSLGVKHAMITVNATGLAPQTINLELTVTNSPAELSLDKTTISAQVGVGSDAADQSFVVSNIGGSAASYTVNSNANWVTASPGSGSLSPSAAQTISLRLQTLNLSVGMHSATITVTMAGATRSLQQLTVSVQVTEPLGAPGKPVALLLED